ncbi:MAG TPA: ABC transporter permease subunit [Acidimicrobiia bacterium]|nr:ABC transporter permease subunit [Acidimicrobiia bacterium]
MNASIHAETLKMVTTRTHRRLALGALGAAAFLATATAGFAGRDGNAALGTASNLANAARGSHVVPLVALVLGILAAAGEFQHGTITQTFLSTPRRRAVVVAKALVAATTGAVLGAAGVVVGLAVATSWSALDGASIHLADATVAGDATGVVVGGALAGAIGVALGLLVRSQAAALVTAFAWTLFGEGVIMLIGGQGVGRWLPGGAAQAASGVGGLLPMWGGALLMAAYTVAIGAVATRLTVARDIG